MGEMTGLVVVGLVGNDVDEANAVFGQLERICVSPEVLQQMPHETIDGS